MITLLSGGIDSAYAQQQIRSKKCLFVDYAQPSAKQEYTAAKNICSFLGAELITTKIAPIGSTMAIGFGVAGPRVVKDRNKSLILAAVGLGYRSIVLGCNLDDHNDYPDCREDFFSEMEEEFDVLILKPCIHLSKKEILKRIHPDILNMSFSCYEPDQMGIPCGSCNSCLERKR